MRRPYLGERWMKGGAEAHRCFDRRSATGMEVGSLGGNGNQEYHATDPRKK